MTNRTPVEVWIAAGAVTVIWICIAVARLKFSHQLPELDEIFDRSATLSGVWITLGVTLVASSVPKRSVRRSLLTYTISAALVAATLARDYWSERSSFSPAQLAAARKRRVAEILAEREADQMSDDARAYFLRKSQPIPSASGKAK